MSQPITVVSPPITVAIERHVDPHRITEATLWTQAGTDLGTTVLVTR